MTKTLIRAARTGTLLFVTAMGVILGNPLAGPVLGIAAVILYRLADYGARQTEHALDLASARRVAELTWELQTRAADLELHRRRLRAQHAAHPRPLVHDRAYREPDLITPAYGLPLLCGVAA